MKNSNNKRTIILIVILIALLIVAYKTMFMSSSPADEDAMVVDEVALSKGENLLKEIESINFDTSIIQNQNFKSLKSIEVPLVSLPVGRKNPFSNVLNSN